MLQELLNESSGASAISGGRPTLVGFTRKVTSLLYTDLVGIHPTYDPIATVFGVRYDLVSQDGQTSMDAQLNHKVGSGRFQFGDSGLSAPTASVDAGDFFIISNYVFQAIKAGDYSALTVKQAFSKVLSGDLRCVADAIPRGTQDDGTEVVQDSRFIVNAWRAEVGTRKLKCPITIETLQDMEAQGFDGQELLEDTLASAMAEDINTDIIMKIITVATKHTALDLSKTDRYYVGRTLIDKACELAATIKSTTTLDPTYVLCSAPTAYAIRASGQVDNNDIIRGTGMKLYQDNDAEAGLEYMVVGVRYIVKDPALIDETEKTAIAAPVYFSPFIQEDEAGTYLVVRDAGSMQPNVGLIARYAISAPPVSADMKVGAKVGNGEDWLTAANKSEYAHALEIILN